MISLRQQMDDSNHEMVNMLTQQIGIVFNPLIQSTNHIYQALTTQIGIITDFFALPQPVHQQIPRIQNNHQIKNPQSLQIVEPMVQR